MSLFIAIVVITHSIFILSAQQNETIQRREETIIFRDSMDSHNEDGNWIIHDMDNLNIPIASPLDPNNMCWSLTPSNTGLRPYFYRLTDLSALTLSSPTMATLRYDIIPYNLPSP